MTSHKTPRRTVSLLLAIVVGFVGAIVHLPQLAAAEEANHPYTTPGVREFNGRQWSTTCEQYSSTVRRCRAEIMATQVRIVEGEYTFVTEFMFNNLTYLPSNRKNWENNPLAAEGQFIKDGRVWKTECNSEWTGKNGCRSFIFASVIESEQVNGAWKFTKADKWLFNNVVQFTAISTPPPPPGPLNPCNVDPPAGWTFTAQGRPHLIKPGYTPADHYNPISLANFIKLAVRNRTMADADRLCFALLGANELMKKAETRTHEGRESLWFPYPFGFSANPAVEDLPTGWNSGLGQAGAMTAMLDLSDMVGELDKPAADRTWEKVATKIYNSYLIPFEDGGFTNRNNGFLWFEEYPTTPVPTVVNNGHHQNVLGLYSYEKRTGDPEALALFEEAVTDMDAQTIKAEVPLEGGIMSSYDLLRGYAATPLRAVSIANGKITQTLLNDKPLTSYPDNTPRHDKATQAAILPVGAAVGASENFVVNSGFTGITNKVPAGWRAINGNTANLRGPDATGMVGAHPSGVAEGWAGLEQDIPASVWTSRANPGSRLSFAMDSRLEIDPGATGTGGKVSIYSVCPAPENKTATTLIHENPKNRSQERTSWSTSDFTAPAANCSIKIQLMTYSYGVNTTTAWYKNVTLRAADALGHHVAPAYDLLVHETPTNTLTIKGTGTVAVEAYYGGRWLKFAEGNLTTTGLKVVVPERYTGRNINYNYHDGHISELQLISCYSGNVALDRIAKRWSSMATRPYKDYSKNENCKAIPMVLDMGGDPMFVEAAPVPMSEVPEVMPTTMALPDEAELASEAPMEE